MQEEKKYIKNIKLYPFYRMFSWDLLFYYAIIFLFLTTEKGLTISEILIADIFLPFSKLIFQIPCVSFVDWFGNKKSIITGNIFICIALFILILSNNLTTLIVFNIILSIGFNLKNLCETSILSGALENENEKYDIFSKLDGKGTSLHYYLDALTSALTGFLFAINGYVPIICCLILFIIATIISFKFEDIRELNTSKNLNRLQKDNFKKYFSELHNIFKFIFRSNRLKGLLLFSGVFSAFLTLMTTLRSSILVSLEVPEVYFGLIVACLQLIAGFSSKLNLYFNRRLKNKTLTIFALFNSISLIIVGIIIILNISKSFGFIVVALWLIIYAITKGAYHPIIRRYLNSFSTSSVNTKIYAAQNVFNSIASIPVILLAASILSVADTSISLIVIGITLSIVFIFLLNYMKSKVGLKPEEYRKSDIEYIELK